MTRCWGWDRDLSVLRAARESQRERWRERESQFVRPTYLCGRGGEVLRLRPLLLMGGSVCTQCWILRIDQHAAYVTERRSVQRTPYSTRPMVPIKVLLGTQARRAWARARTAEHGGARCRAKAHDHDTSTARPHTHTAMTNPSRESCSPTLPRARTHPTPRLTTPLSSTISTSPLHRALPPTNGPYK
ncbi:uncharacterized protein K452DRAFT_142348 [Aplosporella prunicola CBS 121167]|uniref:Uncharacterized protein n=1 Tax=Aplosporella prunicola CBS 121167 TaxID=1176127 RepID=A0A6A6BMH6_9PEZI|nr:uncharacterized protein K452DRAFT_142348 [Aplosporella prunicola CBS 121167]KAF2144475.1 hypothetical protein K452DRAFT_142348 [Aplosporella prunicola CBS 121167]